MTSDQRTDPADDAPLDPREMLALIQGETTAVRRALEAQTPVYYFVWGIAWLVGYVVYWAGSPGSGSPIVLPQLPATIAFAAFIVAAAVISAVVGIRSNRGIKGTSQWVGTIYGLSWPILGFAIASVGFSLIRQGMSPELASIYFTSSYALLVTALYLAGAMLWHSLDQLVIAIILAVAAGVTPMFGYPNHLLAMAFIAGPALLAGGVIATIRNRRL